MNKPINWEEVGAELAREDFEKSKRGSILFIKDKNDLNWDICLAHWEKLLTLDYWKNWQQKVHECRDNDELGFYTRRLSSLIDFIRENTIKGRVNQPDPNINEVSRLIQQEEKRLENISEEDFKKEDKFADIGFKELSAEEMLNDPWFNEQFFGSERKEENKKGSENQEKESSNMNYKSWTKEQLIAEINRLKAENEELKSNKSLTNSEKESRLRSNQQKLKELNSYYNADSSQSNISNDKFLANVIVGGASLLAIIGGLLAVLIYKNKKSKK